MSSTATTRRTLSTIDFVVNEQHYGDLIRRVRFFGAPSFFDCCFSLLIGAESRNLFFVERRSNPRIGRRSGQPVDRLEFVQSSGQLAQEIRRQVDRCREIRSAESRTFVFVFRSLSYLELDKHRLVVDRSIKQFDEILGACRTDRSHQFISLINFMIENFPLGSI